MSGHRIWRGSCIAKVAVGVIAGLMSFGGALYASEQAADVKMPETAEEHLAMAESYREKVRLYLQEVETHQRMLEDYKKRAAYSPKASVENPWLKKMRKHCQAHINNARRLAEEAQEFADYHEILGKELQGQ